MARAGVAEKRKQEREAARVAANAAIQTARTHVLEAKAKAREADERAAADCLVIAIHALDMAHIEG